MIQINAEILRKFNPCESRFDDNFLVHYPYFNGTWSEFLELDKISYEDKIWVATRLLNKNQLVHFAVLCAEHCSDNFNKMYPEDRRVSDCIDYLKSIPDYSNLTLEEISRIKSHESAAWSARSAAESAAWLAASSAAESAAWSARSAESAARSAESAARSAAESAAWLAASSAAWSAAWLAASSAAELAAWLAESAIISFLKIVEDL